MAAIAGRSAVGSYPSFNRDGPEVEVVLKSADDSALAEAVMWLGAELDTVPPRT